MQRSVEEAIKMDIYVFKDRLRMKRRIHIGIGRWMFEEEDIFTVSPSLGL